MASDIGGIAVAGDTSDGLTVAEAVDAAVSAYGGIDIVVASAGVGFEGSVGDMDVDAWTRTLEINVNGPMLVFRHRPWRKPLSASRNWRRRRHRSRMPEARPDRQHPHGIRVVGGEQWSTSGRSAGGRFKWCSRIELTGSDRSLRGSSARLIAGDQDLPASVMIGVDYARFTAAEEPKPPPPRPRSHSHDRFRASSRPSARRWY